LFFNHSVKTVFFSVLFVNLFAYISTLPERQQIVSCGEDKYLRVLDLESGTESFVKDMKDTVM